MEDRLFDPTPTLTVGELNQRISTVVGRAFGDEVWVQGEISGLRPERRPGTHLFFDLIESGDDGAPRARLRVALWADNRRGINALLRRAGGMRMEDGLDVRIRGSVEFFRKGGTLQLKMTSIDPEHTLGRLAAARERTLAALRGEGLVEANGRLTLPAFPMRVALVTSAGSAACQDVLAELEASGLAWQVTVVDTRVQGREAEAMVCQALELLGGGGHDVVLLARGGGSRADLATFDGEAVARAVAAAPVPVITGLGHEEDRSIVDEVAHTAHKTPTAAAAHLVAMVRGDLARVGESWNRVADRATVLLDRAESGLQRRSVDAPQAARASVSGAATRLEGAGRRLQQGTGAAIAVARARHTQAADRLARAAPQSLARADSTLTAMGDRLTALDPMRVLARGWSITATPDGSIVRSTADAPPGTTLVTTVADGRFVSTVESTVSTPSPQEP